MTAALRTWFDPGIVVIRLSVYENTKNVVPLANEMSWEELSLLLSSHDFSFRAKHDAPLFSPAELKPGSTRANASVLRVHFGVIDLDERTPEEVSRLVDRLRAEHRAFVFYTSWSHAETFIESGTICARLVFPFSRPVEAHEWDKVWQRMNAAHDGLADEACKPLHQPYFFPVAPPGSEELQIIDVNHGLPWDVSSDGVPLPAPELRTRRVTVADLQELLKGLSGARAESKVWYRAHLRKLISGESLAQHGNRDDTVWKLCCCILDDIPNAEPESLGALFAPSLQIMRAEAPDCISVGGVIDKIRRKQQEHVEDAVASEQIAEDERKRMIRAAFDLQDRDWPYTADELAGFASSLGCTVEDLRHFWIVQKDNAYYVFVNGRYRGPFTGLELEKAAQQYLSPAHSAGVELYYMGFKGDTIPKDTKRLMRDYGTLAESVHVDMTAQRSYYDRIRRVIIEAPCPMRVYEARYDADVAKWLELLGGEQRTKLADWCSVVTRLDEPCAALYLEGMKGVGKSLFAEGVARLWTDRGTVSLADAMAAFNDAVIQCPVIFADEAVPRDFRGQTRTGELRQFIQARTRTLRRKYLSSAQLKGCVRLVLAANNADMIHSNEHLTVNDIDAIVDRVLHVDANDAREARDFLKAIGKTRVREFVEGDIIAKHCLWLRDNHRADTEHRFLVTGNHSKLHRRLTTSSGLRSAVCNWLVAYLMEPRKVDSTQALLVRVHQGRLLANVRALSKHWMVYETNVDPPNTGNLSAALSGLAHADKVQLTDGTGQRTYYWHVDKDNLVSWAEDNGYASKEAIDEALKKDTKSKS